MNNIRSLIPSFDQEGKCDNPADLVRAVGSASFSLIEENLPILEQSLSFTLVQDLYIEHDMNRQEGSASVTGLLSEDKLYTENLTVKETLTNSLMLISLIKYKRHS